MDAFDALSASRNEFDRRLRLVRGDHWSRPTPCDEWGVRELVNHVIGGCLRYAMLLRGAGPDEVNATRSLDHIGSDPVGSFAETADGMTDAFREPGALERVVHHPSGDRSGRVLLDMRITDFGIHAWDLARALGTDEGLDPRLTEYLSTALPPLVEELSPKGLFKAAVDAPSADGSTFAKVLHLAGRRL